MDSSFYPIVVCCMFTFILISFYIIRYSVFSLYRKQIRGILNTVSTGPRASLAPTQSAIYQPGGSGVAVVSNFSGNGHNSCPTYGGEDTINGNGGYYLSGLYNASSNEGGPSIDGDLVSGPSLQPPPFPLYDSIPPPSPYESVAISNVMPLQHAPDCGGVYFYTSNTTGTENVRTDAV